MPARLELAGQRFGRLTVREHTTQDKHRAWRWLCACDCGALVDVRGATLVAGKTSACASCAVSIAQTTHGMTGTPLYLRWRAMLDRTGNPSHHQYENYGGRGIAVCERWRSFENFAIDMGATFDPALSLDRRDNNGNYEPGNCRWATSTEQQLNRRNNHRLTWRGSTKTVQEWGQALGLKPNSIITRIRRGWSVERALTKGADAELLEVANG